MRIRPLASLLLLAAAPVQAQQEQHDLGPAVEGQRIDTVIPGARYRAGILHRLLLGNHYRDLWVTPIKVPVLDLHAFAGGLTPEKRGGSRQTIGIRFKGADGLEYNFRSVDKFPANALPPALKKSLVEKVFKDQMSAEYPAGALVVSSLLDAAGVIHAHPRLYVMPDDPALGKFREEFAGLLGTIEEHRPKIRGARKIAETAEMFDSLENSTYQRIDGVEYLRARLMDVLIGDWDRHSDQWQWAAFSDGPGRLVWRPVPEDRDWAFAKMDGPIAMFVRQYFPQTIGFGKDYPPILDLTWTAKDLDRRLLSSLDRKTWDSVVTDLKHRLTDSAIAAAVANQPRPFQEKEGAWLTEALLSRRDHLGDAAGDFYEQLSKEVDIHATDLPEAVTIEHRPDGTLAVRIRPVEAAPIDPTFERVFQPGETHEVRVYLHGGPDSAVVRGKRGSIKVRVIGGPEDLLMDSSRGARYYPDRTDKLVEPESKKGKKGAPTAPPTSDLSGPALEETLASETFGPAARPSDFLKTYPLDWGQRWVNLPWAEFHPGQGIVVGVETNHYTYGFRSAPYKKKFKVKAGWAFGAGGPRIESYAEHRQLMQPGGRFDLGGRIDVKASRVETVRFFGFGNNTPYLRGSDGRYIEDYVRISPSLFYDGPRLHASLGPMVQFASPREDPLSLLSAASPFGHGGLWLWGMDGTAGWNVGKEPGKGIGGRIRFDGRAARSLGTDSAHFFRLGSEAVVYTQIPLPKEPTFAIRAGTVKVWGAFPFQEAALLGGQRSLRGYSTDRYAGDRSVYMGTDLRIPVMSTKGTAGGFVFLADAGRVYYGGQSVGPLHKGYGGGIWGGSPSFFIVDLVLAHAERFVLNVYTGFGF